jgi:malate dehydrogenase (oxaloacetate-decarboxylating)
VSDSVRQDAKTPQVVLGDEEIFEAHVDGKLSVELKAPLDTQRVVISGVGAAGAACANILLAAGISDITVVDTRGILHPGRDGPTSVKAELAERTNPDSLTGALDAGARRITEKMKVAAAEAIFSVASDDLAPDRIVPSPFDPRVGPAVASAVAAAADEI